MKHFGFILLVIYLCGLAGPVNAQEQDKGGNSQVSVFIGNVLPNGVDGANEIFTLGGGRYSLPMGSSGTAFSEFSLFYGDDEGVEWKSVAASLRMDVPIETLVGFAYVGLDYTQHSGEGVGNTTTFGGHAGGGVLAHIGGNCSARFDMKLNSKPGTALLFSIGLNFELGGGGEAGAEGP